MIRHLLLDLDGTLLGVSMGRFFPAMITSLQAHLKDVLPADVLLRGLDRALRKMMASTDATRTVLEVFVAVFSAETGLPPMQVESSFDEFYKGSFRGLSGLAAKVEAAARVIELGRAKGLGLTLATQPVFPLAAIRERIAWAGLDDSCFRLITTAELMHACKPWPEYYLEVLDMLGAAAEECLMVGNDWSLDLPAKKAGIATFLVEGEFETGRPGETTPDFRGRLADVASFIENL